MSRCPWLRQLANVNWLMEGSGQMLTCYSSTPLATWSRCFPVPTDQPDRSGSVNPLIAPRPNWADLNSIVGQNDAPYRCTTTRSCLLSEDGTQRNFFFPKKGLELGDRWRRVNVVLPMPSDVKFRANKPYSELDSPFMRIRHMLKIRFMCTSSHWGADVPDGVSFKPRFEITRSMVEWKSEEAEFWEMSMLS